jgi:predicted permease
VATQSLLLLCSLLAGAACQRLRSSGRVRDRVWLAYFWTVSPLLVFVAFSRLRLDSALALALASAVLASWLTGALAYGYAALVSSGRDERGALALGAAFGNTGFVGYPLAQLAFGHSGLAFAVVYDRVSWLLPASSVSASVARLHGRRAPDVGARRPISAVLANPPLWALALALLLGAAGAVPPLGTAGTVSAGLVGPVGFFLLGLAIPLDPPAHEGAELGRAAGAIAIRLAGGPLALLAVSTALGAHVPAVFYLLAGMPSAFHLLVLARVYELRPALMRLIVVASTVPAVVGVALVSALAR